MTTAGACRALYVHVPFCRRRCGYCDFYSQVLDPALAGPAVDAILRDLERQARGDGPRFDTLYVGGGTPTALPRPELERLLAGLRARAEPPERCEFTVEANPETATDEQIAALAAAGVNRVSLGAQSFAPAELRALSRTHAPADVARSAAACRRHGIRSLSLDLIFGIPGQTPASWQRSLAAALAVGPDHVSCYGLTYEPGTPLTRRRDAGLVRPVDEDLEAELYEQAVDTLAAAGLAQYEISNFARPGAECRHNLRYWHNEPYLGIGPAAAGFVGGVRYRNVADVAAYCAAVAAGRSPWCEQERLTGVARAREAAMLELRLVAGIDRRRFAARYGADPAGLFADAIARHAADGLLELDAAGLRLTRRGRLLADTVIADFLGGC